MNEESEILKEAIGRLGSHKMQAREINPCAVVVPFSRTVKALKALSVFYEDEIKKMQEKSVKNDYKDGKNLMQLLPFADLYEIAKVFTQWGKTSTFGAWKEVPDGYEYFKGDLLLRLKSLEQGQSEDSEGMLNAAVLAADAIAVLYYKIRQYRRYDALQEPWIIDDPLLEDTVFKTESEVMMQLLPFEELYEIAAVYTAGAKKYGPNRWQHLEDGYARYQGAMLRHLTFVEEGVVRDEETQCLHAAQVAWNAIAMLHYWIEEHKQNEDGK